MAEVWVSIERGCGTTGSVSTHLDLEFLQLLRSVVEVLGLAEHSLMRPIHSSGLC